MRHLLLSLGLCTLLPGPAVALSLGFPAEAVVLAQKQENPGSTRLALGPWQDGAVAFRPGEGAVSHESWRLDGAQLSTLEVFAALRKQIETAGFDILFECETEICGGFDFRYAIDVLAEPMMHVDLGDFRYLSAQRMDGQQASLLVSRGSGSVFVQLTQLRPGAVRGANTLHFPEKPAPALPGDLALRLEADGAVTLEDLRFDTGSATLGAGEFASLAELAAYLAAHPQRGVMLVGHTDAQGGLEANTALSRQRAASVREHLLSAHGVNPAQVGAEGAGFLAPRASNLTEEGRLRNRRVEVVLTSTD